MAKLRDVMRQLTALGTEQTRKTFARHGIEGDVFGVKVGDLKQVVKPIRGDQLLAEALYATGNYDAMYLAGLIGSGAKMSEASLRGWAEQAKWHAIAGTAVAWVATESEHAEFLAASWIDDERELVQSAGWVTLCGIVATRDDAALDEHSQGPDA